MSVKPQEPLDGRARVGRRAIDRDGLRGGRVERERVDDIQRVRMLAAMVEVAGERGAGNVTVAHVVGRAGVSRRTFYEIFDDAEDCLLAAIEMALGSVSVRVLAAHRSGGGSWCERVRAGLTALLLFCEEEPSAARMLFVESLGCGSAVLERRASVLGVLVGVVDEGREHAKESSTASSLTRLTAEGVVGAVLAVIHARLLEEENEGLVELAGPLMSMVVLPYLGRAAARRELQRPPEEPPSPSSSSSSAAAAAVVRGGVVAGTGNPLKDLHMRLTYRTMRVLATVAANPGSSNRTIGRASGIGDQGQTSKLLARLQRLGLIENTAGRHTAPGGSNAWTLTNHGEHIHRSLTTNQNAYHTTAAP